MKRYTNWLHWNLKITVLPQKRVIKKNLDSKPCQQQSTTQLVTFSLSGHISTRRKHNLPKSSPSSPCWGGPWWGCWRGSPRTGPVWRPGYGSTGPRGSSCSGPAATTERKVSELQYTTDISSVVKCISEPGTFVRIWIRIFFPASGSGSA